MERLKVPDHFDNIWFNINRLKWSNKLNDRRISDILQVTQSDFESMQVACETPRMDSLISLSEYFEISLDELINSKISVRKALKNNLSSKIELPQRFAIAAHSKARTSYHIINFLEQKNKFDLIEQFLNYTEVPYEIFNDLNNQINIDFITELCGWLTEKSIVGSKDLYLMGLNTYEVNKNSEMADKLSSFSSLKEMYVFQTEEFMNFFDKNAHYRIKKISDTKCVIAWTHNKDVCEGLKKKRISSIQVETYQLGVAASVPLFLNLPASKVKMISSLQFGSRETAFEVDFTEAREILKKRKRLKMVHATKELMEEKS